MYFLDRLSKDTQISKLTKIRPVGADGRIDRRTDMTKLIVSLHNSVNAPKNRNRQYQPFLSVPNASTANGAVYKPLRQVTLSNAVLDRQAPSVRNSSSNTNLMQTSVIIGIKYRPREQSRDRISFVVRGGC